MPAEPGVPREAAEAIPQEAIPLEPIPQEAIPQEPADSSKCPQPGQEPARLPRQRGWGEGGEWQGSAGLAHAQRVRAGHGGRGAAGVLVDFWELR